MTIDRSLDVREFRLALVRKEAISNPDGIHDLWMKHCRLKLPMTYGAFLEKVSNQAKKLLDPSGA